MSWHEAENRTKDLEKVSHYRNPEIKGRGSVRARLTSSERVNFLMEEDKNLMPHDMPRLFKEADKPLAVLHLGKDYVYGSFRENLSAAEKRQLKDGLSVK